MYLIRQRLDVSFHLGSQLSGACKVVFCFPSGGQGGQIDLAKRPLQLLPPQLIQLVACFELQLMYHQPQFLRHFFINVLESERCLFLESCVALFIGSIRTMLGALLFPQHLETVWTCPSHIGGASEPVNGVISAFFERLEIVWVVFSKVVADSRDIVVVVCISLIRFFSSRLLWRPAQRIFSAFYLVLAAPAVFDNFSIFSACCCLLLLLSP